MRIESSGANAVEDRVTRSLGKAGPSGAAAEGDHTARAHAPGGAYTVSLSQRAAELARADDGSRVHALRGAIDQETFVVDAAAVARRLLEEG